MKCIVCEYDGSMESIYGIDEHDNYVSVQVDSFNTTLNNRRHKLDILVCPACGSVMAAK